jgi:hypothetical protein
MRLHLLFAGLFVLLALPGLAAAQSDSGGCAVAENYIEALEENQWALLRINLRFNTGSGPLINSLATARVTYSQLMSIRTYHEDQRSVLPDCAQALNAGMIDTITAAQDVFGILFLQGLDAENRQFYQNDIVNAVEKLRIKFGDLNMLEAEANLTIDPDA